MPHMKEAPARSQSLAHEKKRKRDVGTGSARQPQKNVVSDSESVRDGNSEILLLENGILESRKNYNGITTLLTYMKVEAAADDRDVVAAVALYRVFCRFMVLGNLTKNGDTSDAEITIVQWLRERLQEFEENLLGFLQSADSAKQTAALTLLMRLIKEKATHLGLSENLTWRDGLFQMVVQRLAKIANGGSIMDEFIEKYVEKYHDVRYYTFVSFGDVESNEKIVTSNVMHMLSAIAYVRKEEAEAKDFFLSPPSKKKHELFSFASHKKQAQKAWMSVLRQDLDRTQRKKILDLMQHRIAPWFLKVELLMDFLTDSFNAGGSTSLMALSGLFYLIQQKNLDYPQFYVKLYSLLDSNILHSKHRSRFFRLLDTFLASTHLPAALVASFIKRLSRLCLFAPPSAIVAVVPWVYNLLQNHPVCTFMIQRKMDLQCRDHGGWGDPFIMAESDPMETDAIESSLWEIDTLHSHYHPNVAAIAKIISEQFTKQAYNIEDFLDHSYATMIDAELSKDIKRPPEIEYEIPKKIFTSYGAGTGKEDGMLVHLWSFS